MEQQDKNINKALSKTNEILLTPLPLLMSEWADEHFYLSAESSGIEGRWKCYPYQIAILNWMGNDNIRVFTWRKSARTGYTKSLLICKGYNVSHRRRNIVIYQPTDSDAADFVRDEVDPMLRDVPAVRNQLRCNPEVKSSFNTMEKKTFFGCILDVKGGKSGRNYRRMTKDIAMYDELDGFAADIDGEGSPTSLGDTRIKTSSFPKSIRGSTPKEKESSQIEQSLRSADSIFARYLPCPQCGHEQFLKWKNITFDKKDHKSAKYACEKNGCVVEYNQYPEMDENGKWKTVSFNKAGKMIDGNGDWYDEKLDLFFNSANEVIDDPRHIGVILWGAYSYHQTWADGVYDFLQARREQKKGDKTKMKSWQNLYLGESYEEKGERIDQEWSERVEDYNTLNAIPNDILMITIGADVQGGKNARIEFEIVGWGLGEESWSLDYVTIPGQAEQPHVWDHLEEYRLKKFTREDGVELPVSGVIVDSGYLADEVFKYTAPRKRYGVYASKGKAQSTGPIAGKATWQGDKKKRKALQIPINTGDAKEIIYTRLEDLDEPGPGYMHFPIHYEDSYFIGLTAEEKQTYYSMGVPKRRWVKIKNRANEPLDCRVYALTALRAINPKLERIKLRFEKIQERQSLNLSVEQPQRGVRRMRSRGLRA